LPTPDAVGDVIVGGADGGKVALTLSSVRDFTPIFCPLTETPPFPMLDFVGYSDELGAPPDCFEGAAAPTTPVNNSKAVIRNDGAGSDTNDNSAAFTVAAPVPRNSASPPHICACSN